MLVASCAAFESQQKKMTNSSTDLKALKTRLNAAKKRNKPEKNNEKLPHAVRVAMDFSSPIFFTLFVGYYVGKKTNSMLISMVISLILGFGAGVLNLIRSESRQENKK